MCMRSSTCRWLNPEELESSCSKVIARRAPSLDWFASSRSAHLAILLAFDDEGRIFASECVLSATSIWLCTAAKSSKEQKKEKRAIKTPKYAITIA